MKLISALGLDLKILIAQFVNFAVLFYVLYRFAYKPLIKFIDDRKDSIEKGVRNAETVERKLIEIEEKEKLVIKNAKIEALAIVEQAKAEAGQKRDDILAKAKDEIGKVIDAEKAKMQIEKAETLKEIKRDAAELVIAAMEKVLSARIDDKSEKELIKKIIKDLQ